MVTIVTISNLKTNFKTDYADLPIHWLEDWLLYVIDKSAIFLITDNDYSLSDSELSQWKQGIEKMQSGTPLPYLTGRQAFWSLEFIVNEHTLIPRPDTEILVEQVLGWIEKASCDRRAHLLMGEVGRENKVGYGINNLLDLGTGSGCIAISLAYELSQLEQNQQNRLGQWAVTAIDFSEQALQVAKQNIKLNQVNNVQLIQSSWYDNLPKPMREQDKFKVIVSNPPYIDKTDEHLPKLTAEPITALVADNHGLADIEQIVSGASNHLQKGGLLAIEHGYDQGQAVQTIFKEYGFVQVQTIKDYGGNDRVTMGVLSD